MKKILISLFSALLSVGCLSSTLETDVSMDHDFQLDLQSNVSGTSAAQECYYPDIAGTLQKINDSDLTWKIVSLQDTVIFNDSTIDSSQFTLTLSLSDNVDGVILSQVPNTSPNLIKLNNPSIDNQALKRILNSSNLQICLFAYGSVHNVSSLQLKNTISFHLDADFNKSL